MKRKVYKLFVMLLAFSLVLSYPVLAAKPDNVKEQNEKKLEEKKDKQDKEEKEEKEKAEKLEKENKAIEKKLEQISKKLDEIGERHEGVVEDIEDYFSIDFVLDQEDEETTTPDEEVDETIEETTEEPTEEPTDSDEDIDETAGGATDEEANESADDPAEDSVKDDEISEDEELEDQELEDEELEDEYSEDLDFSDEIEEETAPNERYNSFGGKLNSMLNQLDSLSKQLALLQVKSPSENEQFLALYNRIQSQGELINKTLEKLEQLIKGTAPQDTTEATDLPDSTEPGSETSEEEIVADEPTESTEETIIDEEATTEEIPSEDTSSEQPPTEQTPEDVTE